jgi:dolichol-phosphate mannosyltransferase
MDGRRGPTEPADWSLSLVIPAYNEEAVIAQAVAEADAALSRLTRAYEILVVDDGSGDGTARAVAAQNRPHVRLLRHPTNRGYGAALRTGFEAARFDRVAFTDADCQFHLDDLALLVEPTERVPVAVGYRVRRQDVWRRRFISWGYNTLVRTLMGTQVRDCDCALKVFRRSALADLLPETTGFFVNTEMLARARQLGLGVEEVGVRHRPRLGGASKVSLWDIPRTLATLLPFWWTRVLFPQSPSLESPERKNQSPERQRGDRPNPSLTLGALISGQGSPGLLLALLLMAVLLFCSRLGCPLQEPEEVRYAEIPRQMLETGTWAVPVLHGQPYLDKPPLLYWLVMLSYGVCGVHDWAARLVPNLAGVLTVLVTYAWGRQTLGRRAAFFGAVALCLSARFVYLGRLLTMNGLLCLWVVAALAAAHVAARGPRLRWGSWLLSALACGLGLLTKGPVALVLVALPVLAWQLLDRRTARPRWPMWLAYAAVAGGIAAPWYLTAAATDPEFADYFFWRHNVLRFVAPFDHEEPAWFYVPGLLLGMLPWSLLLLPLLKSLGRRTGPEAAERPAALGFFLLAALWGVLFYSAAGCKRPGYILPAMPPVALALGWFLDAVLRREQEAGMLAWGRLGLRLSRLVLVGGVGGAGLAWAAGILSPAATAGVAGVGLLGLFALTRISPPRGAGVAWGLCGVTTFAVLLAAVHLVLPGYARKFSMRGSLRPQAGLGLTADVPVLCYPRRWDSVSYYLGRSDVRVFPRERRPQLIAELRARPKTLLIVKSDRSLKELLRDLPASLEFTPRGRRGNVTVGLVRPRREAPAALFANR